MTDLKKAKFWTHVPSWSNCLHFYVVFGKIWPDNRLALPSPLGLVPPLGDPGSVPEMGPFSTRVLLFALFLKSLLIHFLQKEIDKFQK